MYTINAIIEIQQSIIQIENFKIEKATRNIVNSKLVYYSNYNLFIYLRVVILLLSKTTVKSDNKSSELDSSLLLSKNKLSNIEKIVQILIIKIFSIYFR